MPVILDKHIGINSRLALWQILESEEELAALLNYRVAPDNYPINEILKKQRLASRILINRLGSELLVKPLMEPFPKSETEHYLQIQYNEFKKPFLPNSAAHISISHSHDQVAVILNNLNETGIDIELIKPQVERIAARFLDERELQSIDETRRTEQLTTFWCAKETLYKYYGKKKISFRGDIYIEPFLQQNSGMLKGHILTKNISVSIPLCYEKRGEYMLVYVND
jgi:4'-phosphopantetheinyl transferase